MNQKVRFGDVGEPKSDIFKRMNRGRIQSWYKPNVDRVIVVHPAIVDPVDYKGIPTIVYQEEV